MHISLVGKMWGRDRTGKHSKPFKCCLGNVCPAWKIGGKAIMRGGPQERVKCDPSCIDKGGGGL